MSKVVKIKENTIVEIEKFRTHSRETWDDLINLIIQKCYRYENKKQNGKKHSFGIWMMKKKRIVRRNKMKIFVLGLITLLFVSMVGASEITILDYGILHNNPYGYSELLSTGDQIWADVKVTTSSGWWNLKRTYVEWDSSRVNCDRKRIEENNTFYYCLLTVTPFMQGEKEVFIVSKDRGNILNKTSLGIFDFKGRPFWQNPHCEVIGRKKICRNRQHL